MKSAITDIRWDTFHNELTIPANIELSEGEEEALESVFRIWEGKTLMLFAKTKIRDERENVKKRNDKKSSGAHRTEQQVFERGHLIQ